MQLNSTIGKNVPRIDAREKVTGEAKYCVDLKFPGMLYGKIKRSPLPFAKIVNIDTSKAKKVSGVKSVITAEDTPKIPYGSFVSDELPLATTLVRYVGDEIAAVAAIDEDVAEEALELIEVDYEELSPVFDPEEAMGPGAPSLHPELEGIKSNIAYHFQYVRGNPDQGFDQADLIIEDRFVTQAQHQSYLEPQACIAECNPSGRLTFWCSLQSPFRSRILIARALGMPEYQIRMIQPYVGGAFGGKGGGIHALYPISAILSKKSGRPVKIVYTRKEEFIAGRPRLPEIIKLRLGLRKNGEIVAKQLKIVADGGGYVGIMPPALTASGTRTSSLYRIQNIRAEADLVYTNNMPKGAFRGFGNPQMHFAMESLLDEAAVRLNIDPRELRLRNATQEGDITAHGWVINSCGLKDSIRKASEDSGWDTKRLGKRKAWGIGIGCFVHVSSNRALHPLYDGSSVIVMMNEYGKVKVISGEGEIGQGLSTVLAQITSEETDIPLKDIEVFPLDTNISPFCVGAFASRCTAMAGNAVKIAAVNLRQELFQAAAEQYEANAEDLEIKNGKICVKGSPDTGISINEVANKAVLKRGGGPLVGIGNYTVPDWVVVPDNKTKYGNMSVGYPFGTQIAEVQVDRETGRVEVLGLWTAFDSGRILNPMAAEGQIEGGIAQGLGFAISESYSMDKGKVLNTSFADYQIPTALDMPPIKIAFIETNDPNTPYGAKGIGEPALIATAPAIANAIFNAIGVRIKELPLTPEKVLREIHKCDHLKSL